MNKIYIIIISTRLWLWYWVGTHYYNYHQGATLSNTSLRNELDSFISYIPEIAAAHSGCGGVVSWGCARPASFALKCSNS